MTKLTDNLAQTPGQLRPLPDTHDFRAWVKSVIHILNLSPHRWSVMAGVGANTLTKLLAEGENKQIRLDTAAKLAATARSAASDRGILLPPLLPPVDRSNQEGGR